MATVLQTFDGIVLVQFQVKLPNQPAPYEFETETIAHISTTLNESVYKGAIYDHQFTTNRIELVHRVLRQAMSDPTPTLRFRVGVKNPSGVSWMPWQATTITGHSSIPQGSGTSSGHVVQIQSADDVFKLNRQSKVICRKGKISQIIQAIADENGYDAVIEETGNSGVYYQTYAGDAEFIRHKLVARAMNTKGRGNYLFYFQDGILHFHTADYMAEMRSIDYYGLAGSNLAATDYSQKLFESGVAGVNVIRYDPYTGIGVEIRSDATRCLRYSDVLYPVDSVSNGRLNIPYHTGDNGDEEVLAMAQAGYEAARSRIFDVAFSLDRLTTLRVGNILDLNIAPAVDKRAPSSGLYLVADSAVQVKDGKAHCRYTLHRGETSRLPGLVAAAGSESLVPELDAPGQPLNLAELSASSIRKGAGNKTSDRTFAILSDPNAGPS